MTSKMAATGFFNFTAGIVTKDWNTHGKFILKLAAAMAVSISLVMRLGPGQDLAKGILVGVAAVAPYGLSQICFFIERQNDLLKRLMVPPITPTKLVLAKYASAFSMALFVINVPGVLLNDLAFVWYVNVGILLLTSITMAVVIVSNQAWAPLLPVWVVLLPYLYARPLLVSTFHWVAAHSTGVSVVALCLIPFIAYGSAWFFEHAEYRRVNG
jgi:hypothetical protein